MLEIDLRRKIFRQANSHMTVHILHIFRKTDASPMFQAQWQLGNYFSGIVLVCAVLVLLCCKAGGIRESAASTLHGHPSLMSSFAVNPVSWWRLNLPSSAIKVKSHWINTVHRKKQDHPFRMLVRVGWRKQINMHLSKWIVKKYLDRLSVYKMLLLTFLRI